MADPESEQPSAGAPPPALLDQFWKLASLDQAARVSAAQQLIIALHGSYKKDETQLSYTIKRLVKGLSSSRDAARQGYALALTEVVGVFGERAAVASPERVLDELEAGAKAAPGAGGHGQDERDRLFGLTFGCVALLRSGRAGTRGPLLVRLAEVLRKLAAQKAFLAEPAHELLAALVDAAEAEPLQAQLLPALLPALAAAPDAYTPEQLGLLLHLRRTCPAARPALTALLQPLGWRGGGALASNLEAVAQVLKEATHTHPKQHSVWRHLLDALLAELSQLGPAAASALVADLWQAVGERVLLLPTASHPRKLVGLALFERLVAALPAAHVPLLFTRNLLRNLITDLADRHSHLHAAAKKALATLLRVATSGSGALRAAVLAQLTGPEGHPRFDALTRTTAVADLLAALEPPAALAHLAQLRDAFRLAPGSLGASRPPPAPASAGSGSGSSSSSSSEADEAGDATRAAEVRREWVLDQLLALSRSPQPAAADATRASSVQAHVLNLLVFHAFCEATPAPSGAKQTREQRAALADVCADACPVGSRVQAAARTRLLAVLRQLSEPPRKEVAGESSSKDADASDKAEKPAPAERDGLWAVQHTLRTLEQLTALPGVRLSRSLPPEAADAVAAARALLEKLQRKAEKETEGKRELLAFEELLAHATLLTYVDAAEGADLLQELLACAPRLLSAARGATKKAKGKDKGKGKKKDEADEAEPDPMAVLMEVLLALLVRPSQLLRAAVEHAFRAFSGRLTPPAFEALLRAIDPAQAEDEPVLDDASDDAADDLVEESDDDDDDDDDDEDNDSANESHSHSRSDAAAPPANKSAGQKRKADSSSSEGSGDSDVDSAELPPATDEEMLRADAKLEAMFRTIKADKRARAERQRAAVDHRFKALELLDAFARRHPDSGLLLDAFPRLLHALRISEGPQRALADKLAGCVRLRLARAHPAPAEVAARRSALLQQLASVVSQLSRTAARPLFVTAASQLLHALLRLLLADPEAAASVREQTVPALARLATQVMTKRRAVRPDLLRELASRHASLLAFPLASALLQAVPNARSAFLRVQCVTIACGMLSQKPLLAEAGARAATEPLLGALSDAVLAAAANADLGKKLHELVKAAARAFHALSRVHSPADLQRLSRGAALVAALEEHAAASASTALPVLLRDLAASVAPEAHARLEQQLRARKQQKQQQRRLKKTKADASDDDGSDAPMNGHAAASGSASDASSSSSKEGKPAVKPKKQSQATAAPPAPAAKQHKADKTDKTDNKTEKSEKKEQQEKKDKKEKKQKREKKEKKEKQLPQAEESKKKGADAADAKKDNAKKRSADSVDRSAKKAK